MSVVGLLGTNVYNYETIYQRICVPNCLLLTYIYSDIKLCRIIDIPDGHFKIQNGGQVSCRFQCHINPCIVKCMNTNFGSPVENIFKNMPD